MNITIKPCRKSCIAWRLITWEENVCRSNFELSQMKSSADCNSPKLIIDFKKFMLMMQYSAEIYDSSLFYQIIFGRKCWHNRNFLLVQRLSLILGEGFITFLAVLHFFPDSFNFVMISWYLYLFISEVENEKYDVAKLIRNIVKSLRNEADLLEN